MNWQRINKFFNWCVAGLGISLLIAPVAFAHVDAGETSNFGHGLQHPIGGLDHILAMVAIGLWAGQLGGHALWAVPLAFVGVMGGGWGMAVAQIPFPVPIVEHGVIASDLILGGLVLCASRFPLWLNCTIAGVMAIFHGYAHGTEMPTTGTAWEYALGFLVATIGLHAVGIGVAVLAQKYLKPLALRILGGLVCAGGIYVMINAIFFPSVE
ncbi:MAG: HupE/UreJ family protein [Pseudanabaenaceae cyanobacterium]